MKRNRVLYTLLSVGAIGTFFGHGMWAIGGKDSFVELFTGSFKNVLGITVAADTATSWVKGIGWLDITLSVIMLLMLIGNVQARGALYRLAYSPIALTIYGWAVLWGFATAASRVTAAGVFVPEIWDFVERAPNFMLPAALVYLVYHHWLDHTHTTTTTEAFGSEMQPTR